MIDEIIRICIVSPDYPTTRTIDFIFVDQLCRAMARKGHEVTVIAPQSITKCLLRRIPIEKNKTIVHLENGSSFLLIRPKYFSVGNCGWILKHHNEQSYEKAVKKAFSVRPYDFTVCYGHFWQSVSAVFHVAKEKEIPLFASSGEETVSQQRVDLTTERINEIRQYICGSIHVSTNNKKECIATGLTTKEKAVVIPNAINGDLFYPRDRQIERKKLGIGTNDFVVAFVGQFTSRKGTLRLDAALKKLNDPSIKAIYVGKGPEEPSYDGIIYKGSLPHDKLPEFLSASDAFVLPTQQEGCCNAIIEAMACGLPIISSNMPFNYDVLNKNNSILINQESLDEIADSIKLLKNNVQLRNDLSQNAMKSAQNLTLDKRVDKIVSFITESINKEKQ